MTFNSFNFIVLFPLLFLLYYVIPAKMCKWRNGYLLLVSYLLYANWKPVYTLILLGVTLVTYFSARLVERSEKKKQIVFLGGAFSLLPLLFFKYFNFINEQVYAVLSIFGLRYDLQGLNWAIPIGISYFTFQAIGYLFDVYYLKSADNFQRSNFAAI